MIASVLKSRILTLVWELLDPFSDVTGVDMLLYKSWFGGKQKWWISLVLWDNQICYDHGQLITWLVRFKFDPFQVLDGRLILY